MSSARSSIMMTSFGILLTLAAILPVALLLGTKVDKNRKQSNTGSMGTHRKSRSTTTTTTMMMTTTMRRRRPGAPNVPLVATASSGAPSPPQQPPSPRGPPDLYTGDSVNVSRLLDSLLRGYDKRLRPNYNGNPVEVGITMFISSVSSISEANMDYTVDFYFRQHWHDPRLRFTEEEEELCISNEMLARIWWPDTFFANAKQANFHTATTHNAFLRIKPSGWITLSLRLTVTSMCTMDLTFFPMDTQICSLEIESYAYSVKHIAYTWKEGPKESVGIDRTLQLPQFSIRGYRTLNKLEILSTGNYSRLACQFYFVRSLGYYVIHIYIPSCLIVVLSWISFWLHRDASPARVSLGITTVLTMTTLIFSSNASLPKISYLKIIDVYLVTCFVMVFTSLLEYACVSYIGNRKPKKRVGGSGNGEHPPEVVRDADAGNRRRKCQQEVRYVNSTHAQSIDRRLPRNCCPALPASRQCPAHCGEKMALALQAPAPTVPRDKDKDKVKVKVNRNASLACAIDKYSRAVFPAIFLVFNVAYWVIFPNISPAPNDTDFDVIN